jgi:hypothetical protein
MVCIAKQLASTACEHFGDSMDELYLQNALKPMEVAFGHQRNKLYSLFVQSNHHSAAYYLFQLLFAHQGLTLALKFL